MKSQRHIVNAKIQIMGLCLCACLVVCLFGLLKPDLPASPMLRESFWAHKVDAAPVYDVVLVGDSRIYRGIDPEIIEQENAHAIRCFNYGFSSAGLDHYLLEKACSLFDPSGKKILVIGVSANSFLKESLQNSHLRSLEQWDHKNVWIKKHLYPGLTFFDPVAPSDLYKLYKGEKYIEEYHLSYGFAASDKIPLDSSSALKAYQQQFKGEPFQGKSEDSFINMIKRFKAKGITVKVIRIPVSGSMKTLEDAYIGIDPLLDILDRSGVKRIRPVGHFISYDGSHLTAASARELSQQVAREVLD
jgi:hypothetical protein